MCLSAVGCYSFKHLSHLLPIVTLSVTSLQYSYFRTPSGALPRYQNLLNLPNFDDIPVPTPPTHGSPSTPPTPSMPGVASGSTGDGLVVHKQFNSPLSMYSDDNVVDAFAGQTGGEIVGVGRPG